MALVSAAIACAALATSCRDDSPSREAFCAAAKEARSDTSVFADFDPENADAAIIDLEAALAVQRSLREKAPKAVRSDLDVIIDFVDDLIAGLSAGDAGVGRPEIYEQLLPRHGEVAEASARLERYLDEACATS